MQAIITKRIPATNRRGPRVKATCQSGSIIIDWYDTEQGDHMCHRDAALELIRKLDWQDQVSIGEGGSMPDGNGYAFELEPAGNWWDNPSHEED